MAEKMLLAFGRYLKLVRERRKLSLEDVATLTKSYPEPINKGYLSRVERGLARVGFSKMVALSHAYEVSLDAFGEKLALDLEVDRMRDAPDTKGKTFGELTQEAIEYRQRGMRWHFYACLRDALHRAGSDPVFGTFRSPDEQVMNATLSFGTGAAAVGRYLLALNEFQYVSAHAELLNDEHRSIVFQQLATAKRHIGRLEEAAGDAAKAVAVAEQAPERLHLGGALETQHNIASQSGDYESAIEIGKRAYAAYKAADGTLDCARMLNNLGQCYFDLKRFGAARRAVIAAERLANELDADAVRSRSRILLGEIELVADRPAKAAALWHEALEIARRSHDTIVHFKAEFLLFKLAVHQQNKTVTNALGRRLERMSPWIPATEPEVIEFRRLYQIHRKPKQRSSVASAQRDRIVGRNST